YCVSLSLVTVMLDCYSLFLFFSSLYSTTISPLSLHDALPIYFAIGLPTEIGVQPDTEDKQPDDWARHTADELPTIAKRAHDLAQDRKSTRLNSSHVKISYAVFCLKKKK